MATKDYKDLSAYIVDEDGNVVKQYDDIVGAAKGYVHRVLKANKGGKFQLLVGVQLKRRQSIDSYIKQVGRALSAHTSDLCCSARKLHGEVNVESLLETLDNMHSTETNILDNGYSGFEVFGFNADFIKKA